LALKKLLDSAIANAENNFNMDPDNLFIKTIMVDEGQVMKRFVPRAQGRAAKILKRSSHITIELAENKKD
jgi:large subunit ribosomal protein L22